MIHILLHHPWHFQRHTIQNPEKTSPNLSASRKSKWAGRWLSVEGTGCTASGLEGRTRVYIWHPCRRGPGGMHALQTCELEVRVETPGPSAC